ncbi:hypothetical protein [Microvirga sp. VF16]|uniref:hypothetical protein n=1 Tax=Microvirga sp. VF16 TaxID=2807101 RepID=UPI00193E6565|nr:hypothetical protein [Microvirga sp. VF16]QRM35133.1 hypothetical protein JO965_39765 [Microvirga sp. VF16]
MAKLCKRRRPLRLEVGFEVRRGSRDVLGRAYERLLPAHPVRVITCTGTVV